MGVLRQNPIPFQGAIENWRKERGRYKGESGAETYKPVCRKTKKAYHCGEMSMTRKRGLAYPSRGRASV